MAGTANGTFGYSPPFTHYYTTEKKKNKMPWKKPAVKSDTSDRVWQVFQEKLGNAGGVLVKTKIGMPRNLESAKEILVYRSTIERRKNVRYCLEHIES